MVARGGGGGGAGGWRLSGGQDGFTGGRLL